MNAGLESDRAGCRIPQLSTLTVSTWASSRICPEIWSKTGLKARMSTPWLTPFETPGMGGGESAPPPSGVVRYSICISRFVNAFSGYSGVDRSLERGWNSRGKSGMESGVWMDSCGRLYTGTIRNAECRMRNSGVGRGFARTAGGDAARARTVGIRRRPGVPRVQAGIPSWNPEGRDCAGGQARTTRGRRVKHWP
jgi:hypothetical protein